MPTGVVTANKTHHSLVVCWSQELVTSYCLLRAIITITVTACLLNSILLFWRIHIHMYAPWLKIDVAFCRGWGTGKKWKIWWKTTENIQRSLRREEKKIACIRLGQQLSRESSQSQTPPGCVWVQRGKDYSEEPKPWISLALKNQHPCRGCELGPQGTCRAFRSWRLLQVRDETQT